MRMNGKRMWIGRVVFVVLALSFGGWTAWARMPWISLRRSAHSFDRVSSQSVSHFDIRFSTSSWGMPLPSSNSFSPASTWALK